MKIFSDLQTENELGGWNKILGETNLKDDYKIWFYKILDFIKLINFWAFALISNPRTMAHFVRQCAIVLKWNLWFPENKHFCKERLKIPLSILYV